MKAKGGGNLPVALKQKMEKSIGSGWTRFVLDGDKLRIVKTANGDVPLTTGMKPLLTVDA